MNFVLILLKILKENKTSMPLQGKQVNYSFHFFLFGLFILSIYLFIFCITVIQWLAITYWLTAQIFQWSQNLSSAQPVCCASKFNLWQLLRLLESLTSNPLFPTFAHRLYYCSVYPKAWLEYLYRLILLKGAEPRIWLPF